jgi:hypothetical protein
MKLLWAKTQLDMTSIKKKKDKTKAPGKIEDQVEIPEPQKSVE